MKKILVPANFSKHSNNAIDFAVHLAKIISAEITILNVFELKGRSEVFKPVLRKISAELTAIKDTIEAKSGIAVNTDIYEGVIDKGILEAVDDKHIDLIVMGTLGDRSIRGKFFGSDTAAVVSKSTVPVLVVPSAYVWKTPRKILLATKYFEKEAAILDFFFELAESLTAEVQIVVFSDENTADNIIEHPSEVTEYEEALKKLYKNATLTAAHLDGAGFRQSLQEYVDQNEIDILAMVTYKRSTIDKILNPSVTKAMSYCTQIPLLAIPVSESRALSPQLHE
jgi:nucleotide-binding universal stress UspA family protein